MILRPLRPLQLQGDPLVKNKGKTQNLKPPIMTHRTSTSHRRLRMHRLSHPRDMRLLTQVVVTMPLVVIGVKVLSSSKERNIPEGAPTWSWTPSRYFGKSYGRTIPARIPVTPNQSRSG